MLCLSSRGYTPQYTPIAQEPSPAGRQNTHSERRRFSEQEPCSSPPPGHAANGGRAGIVSKSLAPFPEQRRALSRTHGIACLPRKRQGAPSSILSILPSIRESTPQAAPGRGTQPRITPKQRRTQQGCHDGTPGWFQSETKRSNPMYYFELPEDEEEV